MWQSSNYAFGIFTTPKVTDVFLLLLLSIQNMML